MQGSKIYFQINILTLPNVVNVQLRPTLTRNCDKLALKSQLNSVYIYLLQ